MYENHIRPAVFKRPWGAISVGTLTWMEGFQEQPPRPAFPPSDRPRESGPPCTRCIHVQGILLQGIEREAEGVKDLLACCSALDDSLG
jgi:hypothetical protein